MRGMMRLTLFALTLGVLAMSEAATTATAAAQEKKLEELKAPWTERVTVRRWAERQSKFLNPKENLGAYWKDTKDGKLLYVQSVTDWLGTVTKGSEITFADGAVYGVDKIEGESAQEGYVCRVTLKKAAPKKDEPKKP